MRWLTRRQTVIGAVVVACVASTIGVAAAARGPSPETTAMIIPDTTDSVGAGTVASTTAVATPTTTARRSTSTTTSTAPVSTSSSTTSTTSTTSSTSSTTSTTIDPALLLATLREGDTGPDVIALQRMLNIVSGADLNPDGNYGPDTVFAVMNFQKFVGFDATGDADHATRALLIEHDAGRSAMLPKWPVPSIGNGGANGCQVAVLGDSLIAYSESLHADALRSANCAPGVDGVGGRSLAWGWQCRVARPGGRRPLLLLSEPEPGNDTCAPSGLELLELWRDARAFGDLVVIALGTNDAGLFDEGRWIRNWSEALRLTGDRPLVFLTTKARPGNPAAAAQDRYSAALRRWCDAQPRCFLADWALTDAATDPASYVDSVHLTRAATQARAAFIRDAAIALFSGRPIPNPRQLPTVIPTLPSTSTTTTTTTPTTTTPITTMPATDDVTPTSTTVTSSPTTSTVPPTVPSITTTTGP